MFNQQVFKAAVVCAIATTLGLFIPKSAQAAAFTSSSAIPSSMTPSDDVQLAQFVAIPSDTPTLSVTGNGIGRVPADQAAIILSYSLNYYPDLSSEPGAAPAAPPAAQASDLKPVTDALVGAGIAAGDITIVREPYSAQALRMTVRVNSPTRERISTLIDLAQGTALKDNKFIGSTSGVVYVSRNCQAAEDAARESAMTSARAQAEALAATAGVTVGELMSISSSPSWGYAGPFPGTSCPTTLDESLKAMSSYGTQPYDPLMPAEVMSANSISLVYSIQP
jgi:uncharacterized protein YggE